MLIGEGGFGGYEDRVTIPPALVGKTLKGRSWDPAFSLFSIIATRTISI